MAEHKKSWVRPARATRSTEDRPESPRPAMSTDTPSASTQSADTATPAATLNTTALPAASVAAASCSSHEPATQSHAHHHDHGGGCCSSTPATNTGIVAPVTAGLEIAQPAGGSCCESSSVTGECATQAETDASESTVDDGALIEALREVIDPELMINIVDLGLVYSINHTDRKAQVEMTLTSPACPAGPQIIMQSKMALEKVEGIDVADIKLVMSPPWTPARMTDEARDQLGIF